MKINYKSIALSSCNTFLILCLLIAVSCKKDKPLPDSVETGSLTDIDGNVYKTIKIGTQWWMAENLKVKTFCDGNPIRQAQFDQDWVDSTAAYCNYNNNTGSPGLLYNWYAVSSESKIAPSGWHVPSDEDWKILETYLGMSHDDADKLSWRGTHEGEKLRIKGTEGWLGYENIWATNESGFTALAGGCRLFNGIWGDPGLFCTGFWWTNTPFSGMEAWYRYLDYKKPNVFRSHVPKSYGYNVRCIKD